MRRRAVELGRLRPGAREETRSVFTDADADAAGHGGGYP